VEELLDTPLSNIDSFANEEAPFDDCDLEPSRYQHSTAEQSVVPVVECLFSPEIFVLADPY
jgi:hypothetical protein